MATFLPTCLKQESSGKEKCPLRRCPSDLRGGKPVGVFFLISSCYVCELIHCYLMGRWFWALYKSKKGTHKEQNRKQCSSGLCLSACLSVRLSLGFPQSDRQTLHPPSRRDSGSVLSFHFSFSSLPPHIVFRH